MLTRENVATLDESSNYRWHLSVAHPERKPTPDELAIAIEKLPDGPAYCTEVTELTIDARYNQVDIWEVHDVPLVMRIADQPKSPVKSRRVECSDCGEPCWLSGTTERRVKLTYDFSKVKIQCDVCLHAEAKND